MYMGGGGELQTGMEEFLLNTFGIPTLELIYLPLKWSYCITFFKTILSLGCETVGSLRPINFLNSLKIPFWIGEHSIFMNSRAFQFIERERDEFNTYRAHVTIR